MKILTKQVKIKKSINNDEIEQSLSKWGEPLRWAVVDILKDEYLIDGVFIEE